ncbi:hypothetical protein AB7813_07590 [Tardiphaga sp. 20_F10_N6_6]|uniref:hypothetical protein n=1 Tax=unclassified Tardiphaga TaxID=2631404 RepID=UPI003F21AB7F
MNKFRKGSEFQKRPVFNDKSTVERVTRSPVKENDTCGISVKLSAGSFMACRTGSAGFAQ